MKHQERVQALRAILRENNLDAFISMHLPNIRYFTGFSGSNALLIISRLSTFFLTDFRYKDQVEVEVTADEKIVGQGSLAELASKKKIFSSLHAIGFESEHLTIAQFELIKKSIKDKKWCSTTRTVEELRSVKDNDEIALIAKAAGISDAVFKKVLGLIKPGVLESDVAAEISYLHKKMGAEKDGFDTIVASGERSALPHGRATSKKILTGEFVTLDFGCIYQGYHSDMTRTICVGKPNAEMKKVYSIVSDAQRKALDVIKTGMTAKSIDAIARDYIASKGYGEYFGHSLGHGVGLEIHETLRLSATSKERLQTGNVVTVEPGIYLPGKFGVRIEDMVVVREQGCEVVTLSPKELIII